MSYIRIRGELIPRLERLSDRTRRLVAKRLCRWSDEESGAGIKVMAMIKRGQLARGDGHQPSPAG
jgi:hypothetical protein